MKCRRCGDNLWVQFTEEDINRDFPIPPQLRTAMLAATVDADRQAELDAIETARERQRDSVYPCPECNQRTFIRWREGHYDPRHNRYACPECRS